MFQMPEYPKIQSIYKRYLEGPDKGRFIEGAWTTPEFKMLQDVEWLWTEKVDGTNIRVGIDFAPNFVGGVRYGGRTDNAQMHIGLQQRLHDIFDHQNYIDVFNVDREKNESFTVVLYGEGYGAKIQKGGGNYKSDGQDFVLFDVLFNRTWLKREDVVDLAVKLGIKVVPICGLGTLNEAIDVIKNAPILLSTWGDFGMEGLVLRPLHELLDRHGRRIITKLKYCDFEKEEYRKEI